MPNGSDTTVWASIDGLREDIKTLIREGCAKREGDISRIKAVEEISRSHGKKLDRIYYVTLVTAGGVIAFLMKSFSPIIFGR